MKIVGGRTAERRPSTGSRTCGGPIFRGTPCSGRPRCPERRFGTVRYPLRMAVRVSTPIDPAQSRAAPRYRGPGAGPLWRRPEEVGVIVLPLVVEGDRARRRLELLFGAVHSLRRALQHDVRRRLRAWHAGHRRTRRDPAGWSGELGLSREAFERRA